MKCESCGINYPPNLVSPVISSGQPTKFLCGICALVHINEIHKTGYASFSGKTAERQRQLAIKYRKEHPDCLPNTQQSQ